MLNSQAHEELGAGSKAKLPLHLLAGLEIPLNSRRWYADNNRLGFGACFGHNFREGDGAVHHLSSCVGEGRGTASNCWRRDGSCVIIDIRNNPGGDDNTAITIINRFCDRKRVAFRRKTKIGPGEDDFTSLKTWHIEPQGDAQFTEPTVLLTCDSVFSGGEAFALTIKQLPHVTIIGNHTNGIFSYQLEKKLPNGWRYCLLYRKYFSADMVCYEGKGVPVDIKLLNKKTDIENGIDPLITRALKMLKSKNAGTANKR